MKLDIETLANILGIVLMLQVIALYVQYRVNKAYKGIGLWLLGSTLMVAGSLLMPLVYLKSPLMLLSALANPLVVGGQVFIYWGIIRFLGVKANKRVPIVIFSIFFITYYFFVFGANSMTGRSLVISTTNMVLMMLTSYMLFRNSDKSILTSARFVAIVFAVFGAYSITRTILGFILPPTYSYDDKNAFLVFNFLAYISCSTLWTFGLIIMVNQRLNAENLEEREKIQRVFNTSPDASMITRFSDGLLVDVNAGFSALTGYTKDEVIGNSTLGINIWVHDADREVFIQELEKAGECENMEFNFQRKDGITFMGMVSAKTILIREELHVISVLRDITEQKKAEEIVRESEEMYRSILNASPDDITITDLQGRILMVSPMAKKMFGYGSDYDGFIGKRILEYIIPEDMERAQANILRMYQGGYPGPNEYHGVRKDRSLFDIEANSGIIRGASGQPVKLVFIIRDVTERKRSEQQINLLIKQLEIEKNAAQLNSITDSLTGLDNRRHLDEIVNAEFFRLKRTDGILSLIMLDVDYFKKYNDKYGHIAGDECLRKIGGILKKVVGRAPDVVARYGGEEFVVVLPETMMEGATLVAERIREEVQALRIPHSESEAAEYVTVSLGVVTKNTKELTSPNEVIELADAAMYQAKLDGRNRVVVFKQKTVN